MNYALIYKHLLDAYYLSSAPWVMIMMVNTYYVLLCARQSFKCICCTRYISCTSLAIVRPGDEKKLKDSFVLWDYVFN